MQTELLLGRLIFSCDIFSNDNQDVQYGSINLPFIRNNREEMKAEMWLNRRPKYLGASYQRLQMVFFPLQLVLWGVL